MSEVYDTSVTCGYRGLAEAERDEGYRRDFLAVLKLDDWNGDEVSDACERLWAKLSPDPLFRQLVAKSPFYSSEDMLMSFMGMFNYDQLWLIHPCICEVLRAGSLSEPTFRQTTTSLE